VFSIAHVACVCSTPIAAKSFSPPAYGPELLSIDLFPLWSIVIVIIQVALGIIIGLIVIVRNGIFGLNLIICHMRPQRPLIAANRPSMIKQPSQP
jgi:hypothetical protein